MKGQPDTCVCVSDTNANDVCLDTNVGKCVPVLSNGSCPSGLPKYADRTQCLTQLWQSSISSIPATNCVPLYAVPSSGVCGAKCTAVGSCDSTLHAHHRVNLKTK